MARQARRDHRAVRPADRGRRGGAVREKCPEEDAQAAAPAERRDGVSELPGGAGVALVTIFDDYGEAELEATGALAPELVARGVRSVLVCGTTGEAAALTSKERVALVAAVRAAVPAGVPVIAGTG